MKLARALTLVALGALLYQGGAAALRSDAFLVRSFEVSGNTHSRVSDEELVDSSGVEVGQHLLGISVEAVAGRLRAVPWVASARVERILPSTVRIHVEERRPGVVLMTQAGPYLVDLDGLVLQQAEEDLVRAYDLPVPLPTPGEHLDSAEFTQASAIIRSLPAEIRVRASAIYAPTVDQVQLVLVGGPVIYYGSAERVEEKNHAALALLGPVGEGPGVIDVRVPSRPTTRAE